MFLIALLSYALLFYNFIGDLFRSMAHHLNKLFEGIFDTFYEAVKSLGQGIEKLAETIGNGLENLLNALRNILTTLFKPILDLIGGIVYFISKLLEIAIGIIRIIFDALRLIVTLIIELIRQLTNLNYTGSQTYFYMPEAYSNGFSFVSDVLSQTGFHITAWILAFFVWVLTVYAAIKIISK